MKIVATIEARMRSTRLPGKVMLPIMGRPMLSLMIERIKSVDEIDEIVIATTTDSSCDIIEDLAKRENVACYRGSEDDVLLRVLDAACFVNGDVIVELCGDCPCIDPGIIKRVIDTFQHNEVDYCANLIKRTFPIGMDVQVFPVSVLRKVDELTDDPRDHEHVSIYIYEHPEMFRLFNVENNIPIEESDIRLTVDTFQDFKLVSCIYERLYPKNKLFSLDDILALVKDEPMLKEINKDIIQKKA